MTELIAIGFSLASPLIVRHGFFCTASGPAAGCARAADGSSVPWPSCACSFACSPAGPCPTALVGDWVGSAAVGVGLAEVWVSEGGFMLVGSGFISRWFVLCGSGLVFELLKGVTPVTPETK